MEPVSKILETWKNPPSAFRSAPFWSWNDKLNPDRLCRQIESMHQAGMGGFFMHSRYGLKTEYLSEDWFRCVSACVAKARELGMKAYLYDEDRWPSGAAGGLVTRPHPEYRMRYVLVNPAEQFESYEQKLGVFDVELDGAGQMKSYRPADEASACPPGWARKAFDLRVQSPSGWHNDGAYLDTLNPQAVAEFIRVNYQSYADRYGKDFGGLVPAIFTDEPNIGSIHRSAKGTEYRLPWTPALAEEFRRRRGYDILPHLPELVYGGADEDFSKARHDYYRTVTELFVENFTQQIGRWCGENRIEMTGHMLLEGSLQEQILAVGACMPHYEHMQWPGIDILCDQTDELMTAKQCASVADQLGRQRVLSELYGCTGWDWPLEGHKFIGDWQYAVGVNFRCPHLTHYSLAGGAKRDYPASIYAHSPWWKHYPVVEDYFARLSLMLTQGTPIRDVLVLHTVESGWGVMFGVQPKPLADLQDPLKRLIYALSGEHYDWDFADESLLAKHGKAKKGKMQVGRLAYKMVVVPPCHTLRKSTVKLLDKYIAGGGKVLFVGRLPDRVDGEISPAAGELAGKASSCGDQAEQFVPAIEGMLPRRVSISEDGHQQQCMWTMLRAIKGGQLIFVQSHDRKAGHRVRVSVAGRGPVVLWDAITGARQRIKASSVEGRVDFGLELAPSGSALLSLGLACPDAAAAKKPPTWRARESFSGPFAVEMTEPNSFPLDYCQYRIGEAQWSEPVPTLKADATVRQHFNLPPRGNHGHQPWYLYATGVVDNAARGAVQLRWTAHITDLPARCLLAVERPENFTITVNGRTAGPVDGYWVDEDIKTLDITSCLQAGDNEILLSMDYRPDMELEDMYLVGEFGVARRGEAAPAPGNMTLVSQPRQLKLGSWLGQGMDFYGGAVNYKLCIRKPARGRVRLNLGEPACTAAVIHVNGKTFVLPWAPFAAEITDALVEGDNEVVVEIVGGRKNILGPLHTPKQAWTGPGEFMPENPKWTKGYLLHDHGLTSPVVVETAAKG